MATKNQGLYAATESALRLKLKSVLSHRDEEIANRKDLNKRYDVQVWRARQEIYNLLGTAVASAEKKLPCHSMGASGDRYLPNSNSDASSSRKRRRNKSIWFD